MVFGDGVPAEDQNLATPVTLVAEPGADLPMLSGLCRLETPPRDLVLRPLRSGDPGVARDRALPRGSLGHGGLGIPRDVPDGMCWLRSRRRPAGERAPASEDRAGAGQDVPALDRCGLFWKSRAPR